MADTTNERKQLVHTAEEIDQILEVDQQHCANEDAHTCAEDKTRWNAAAETADAAAAAVTALNKNIFGTAAILPSGTNLDDLLTVGAYRSDSSTHTATLVNCPTEYGFRLEVKAMSASNRVVHILYPSVTVGASFYIRRYGASGWGSWVGFLGDTYWENRVAALETRIADLEAAAGITAQEG